MWSVVDRNVVMQRIPVHLLSNLTNYYFCNETRNFLPNKKGDISDRQSHELFFYKERRIVYPYVPALGIRSVAL